MGAWRMRAVLYAMLGIVCGLVLWQSGALAGQPEQPELPVTPRPFAGRLPGGGSIHLQMRDGRLTSFGFERLPTGCDRPRDRWLYWQPGWTPDYPSAQVVQEGDRILLHTWPERGEQKAWLEVNGRLAASGDAVRGTIAVMYDTHRGHCEDLVRFTAAKP